MRLWDTAESNDEPLITYRGHTGPVYALSWSPDGHYLASAGQDVTVQFWLANTGKAIYTYRSHTRPVKALACSASSNLLASGGDDTSVQVWSALQEDRRAVFTDHRSWIRSLAWSPDSTRIATSSIRSIVLAIRLTLLDRVM